MNNSNKENSQNVNDNSTQNRNTNMNNENVEIEENVNDNSTQNRNTNMNNENVEIEENDKSVLDELTEGKLYKFENGEMIELQIDPDELRKVKITDDAIEAATVIQKEMRKVLNGFKPDITTVCSALIKGQANKKDATKVVADFWLEKAQIAASSISADT